MKRLLKLMIIVGLIVLNATTVWAELPVGKKPAAVILQDKEGGKVDGSSWSSKELKEKVYTVFYVDPDEKDLNEHVTEALVDADLPKDKYGAVVILNLEASWLPNSAIESELKETQEAFPKTIYVMDKKKILVKKWQLEDNTFDVLVFNKSGKVVFSKDGELEDEDVEKMIKAIQAHL